MQSSLSSDPLPNKLPRPPLRGRGVFAFPREIIETIALIVVIFALVNLASARFIVDGQSMEPNFTNEQYIIVSRANYLFGQPQRGDIVVFHYPQDTTKDYIKRVIGMPGDTLEMRDQQVYINGFLLEEPYINEPCEPSRCPNRIWEIGADEYFVMGDNRNHSSDSRSFNAVNIQYVVGEALLRYWPPRDWGLLTHLGYDRTVPTPMATP